MNYLSTSYNRARKIFSPCYIFKTLFALLLILSMLSCSSDSTPPPKTWTILVYLDGDNNLSQAAIADLNELKKATSSPYINIIVQLDLPNSIPTKRYRIINNQLDPIADLGELDMSAEATITDFLKWGGTTYPAERTVLLLWDHGNGWDQATTQKTAPKNVASMFIDTDNNGPFLANYKIRNAIKASGIKLDVLAFDGCSMGTLETLYEFRDVADVIISSEDLVSNYGWDYAGLISGLAAQPGMSVEEFGSLAVNVYRNFYENITGLEHSATISALRSSALQEIAEVVNSAAVDLISRIDNPLTRAETISLLSQARKNAQEIAREAPAYVYVDLLDLMMRLDPASTLPASMAKATIAEYHGSARPGANGIAIVFFLLPEAKMYNSFDANYSNYNLTTKSGNKGEFIQSYNWDELLAAYYLYAGL